MAPTNTTPTSDAEKQSKSLFHNDGYVLRRGVLVGGALIGALSLLVMFWYLGVGWANGQALVLTLFAVILWLLIGSTLRHRFRFGIRTMLILTTVAAIPFALVGHRWYELQDRREALANLDEIDASVSVSYDLKEQGDWTRTTSGWQLPTWLVSAMGEDFFADPRHLQIEGMHLDNDVLAKCDLTGFPRISISGANFNDDGAAVFSGLTDLEGLSLHDTAVTDKSLVHLTECTNLGFLNVVDCDISDAGLEHLAGLDKLHTMYFVYTSVTGEGLEHLRDAPSLSTLWLVRSMVSIEGAKGIACLESLQRLNLMGSYVGDVEVAHFTKLTNLRHINLDGTDVGDEGLRYLSQLPNLETLVLSGTLVSDVGLVHLERHPKLETVGLRDTNVTSAGVARLKQVLPDCKVLYTP